MRESGSPGNNRSRFRLRLKFSRGGALKFVGNNDFIRLWERACRRAGLPLSYSEGFSPHPRISIGAPLPIGMDSEAELVDIFLDRYVAPDSFMAKLSPQLPGDLRVLEIRYVSPALLSLQSQVKALEYCVTVRSDRSEQEITSAIGGLMAAERMDWVQRREIGDTSYDLRPLVDDVRLQGFEGGVATIGMRLASGAEGTGRPEQVLKALGFEEPAESIMRTRLVLDDRR